MPGAIIGGGITTPTLNSKLNIDAGLLAVARKEIEIRIDNLNIRRSNNVCPGDHSLAAHFEVHAGGIHTIEFQAQLLDLKHYLNNVFAHTRNVTKFMQHICDAYRRNSRAL